MSEPAGERLYQLLPAIYRVRDQAEGQPLRALLAVIEAELEALEADVGGLYENWFIETCEEWVVPYIGSLLGVGQLHAGCAGVFSLRAFVANALAYRRGKGTASVLERVARDVTGWAARAVEFFDLVATTQHVNHVRPHNVRTPDLRDPDALDRLGTPFDTIAHTPDVRRIGTGRGRHNIPNVGLFLWRLQSYFVERCVPARAADCTAGECYRFSPLGRDLPLLNRPQTRTEAGGLAEEVHVPARLRERPLRDDLAALREALAKGETPNARDFGIHPVVEVHVTDSEGTKAVPAEEIVIADLGGWEEAGWQPPVSTEVKRMGGDPLETQVAIDPSRGRFAFLKGARAHQDVAVSYAYGFSADVGGGPYNRTECVLAELPEKIDWEVGVSREVGVSGDRILDSLSKAIEAWNTRAEQEPSTAGVIVVMDSASYSVGPQATVKIPPGSVLAIVSAGWPEVESPSGGTQRLDGQVVADGLRPHLSGGLHIRGIGAAGGDAGRITVDGFLIEGGVTVEPGSLGGLRISHCTLATGSGGLVVDTSDEGTNEQLRVEMGRSICQSIALARPVPGLWVQECVIDQEGGVSISAPGTKAEIDGSTVLGSSTFRKLKASSCIFVGKIDVQRRQAGHVRYSYVRPGSRIPRPFRCEPQLEVDTQIERAADRPVGRGPGSPQASRDDVEQGVLSWLKPAFSSTEYGQPSYAQLAQRCPHQIAVGAEDGSEMGVFGHLMQPQREANLRASLDEYLRLGLEAGLIYVT